MSIRKAKKFLPGWQVVLLGPAQVQTCEVGSRPVPGGGSRLSLRESPDAKSRGGEAFLIQPAQLGGLVVFSGPAQVRTCEVVSRPTPGGSPAFSGESRRKERRGLCPLDPRFFMARSLSLARFGGCAALFRSWGYYGTYLHALIWKLSFAKMLFIIFFSENASQIGLRISEEIAPLPYQK